MNGAVVSGIRPAAKDGFLLDEVPWEHFPRGDHVREAVHLLHTGNSPARTGAGVVGGMCADDMRAAAVLAVPFLIRIAADTRHPYRTEALAQVSSPARARHFGVASRGELLLHRGHIRYDDLADDYDDYGVEVTGYPAGWSAAAARAAISADTALLQPLLDGPDRMTRAAFRTRLAAEQDPIVRAGLVLAVAEATRAHPHPPTTAWLRERWRDRTQAPEVRPAAAIGWLCLTREPAPDDLRAAVDHLTTEERARAMETLPWMVSAGATGETGLQRCVRTMLHAERPEPNEDPWAQPR